MRFISGNVISSSVLLAVGESWLLLPLGRVMLRTSPLADLDDFVEVAYAVDDLVANHFSISFLTALAARSINSCLSESALSSSDSNSIYAWNNAIRLVIILIVLSTQRSVLGRNEGQ